MTLKCYSFHSSGGEGKRISIILRKRGVDELFWKEGLMEKEWSVFGGESGFLEREIINFTKDVVPLIIFTYVFRLFRFIRTLLVVFYLIKKCIDVNTSEY